jgi:hypothetical protein
MTISVGNSAFVTGGGQSVNLSAAFNITAGANNPTYLVLNGLDRNEYTAGSTGATGLLSGNGHSALFGSIGDDGRGVGIVFTYQAASGRYYNSSYGYFDQITYTTSTNSNDVTNLSVFGTSSLSTANTYARDAYSLLQTATFYGSATFATQAGYGQVPTQATPDSIAKIAQTFVGKAWNANGCWTLASTIAAEAGAGLPVDSTALGLSGNGNGEWFVAFDGSKQTGNWQAMVKAGEMIVIGNASGGHITTCVSGSGGTAMLIDNITYLNSSGGVMNSANDGSPYDVIVSAAHAASQEWSGVNASLVKIYELDTPVVSTLVATDSLAASKSQSLAQLFSAVDPAGKTVTQYQIYDTAGTDSLVVNGGNVSAHTAASAVTVASLSAVSLLAGSTQTTDTLEVRAFNGSYWGDWQALNVAVGQGGTTAIAASAPVVSSQTANQTWHLGQKVSLTLAGNTFTDPQGQTLKYSAQLANGQALPSWLSFNPATETFSGTTPSSAIGPLSLKVTATDTSGLSSSETFQVQLLASAPVLAHQTADQVWRPGKSVSFTLAQNTFTDPQGQKLSYAAYQDSGPSIVSWLRFNANTLTFTGNAPANSAGTVTLEVDATDTSGLTTADVFNVTFSNGTTSITHGIHLVGSAGAEHLQLHG